MACEKRVLIQDFYFADWIVKRIDIKLFLFFSNFPLCELKGNEIIFLRLFPLERWWKIILFFSSIFLRFFTYYLKTGLFLENEVYLVYFNCLNGFKH